MIAKVWELAGLMVDEKDKKGRKIMPIRMTGMVSGLDTDSIVKELVSAYSTKKEKYEKERTKLGWKQEIWKSLNKEVNSFIRVLVICGLTADTIPKDNIVRQHEGNRQCERKCDCRNTETACAFYRAVRLSDGG